MDLSRPSRTPQRRGLIRGFGWLFAAGLLVFAALAPATVSASGPGNNGADPTGNGTTSHAKVGGVLAAAADSATMGSAKIFCQGDSVGHIDGSFTLTKTLDVGSVITVYLAPNNGSNADPIGNVSKNETSITLTAANNTSGSVIDWSITVTSAFTATTGGILGVFAVNEGGSVISPSKTNSLNCGETETTTTSTTTTPTTTSTTTTETTTETTTSETTSTGSESSTTSTTSETTSTGSESSTTSQSSTTTQSTSTGTESSVSTTTTSSSTGEELGVVGTPGVTPPPTDTASVAATAGSDTGFRIVLIGLSMLLMVLLLLQPKEAFVRNK